MKSIHVIFTKLTPEEWRAFSSACRANGETMTKVLMREIKRYTEQTEKHAQLNAIMEGRVTP